MIEEKKFCPICSGLSEDTINRMLSGALTKTFAPGEALYSQNESYRGIYVVIRGQVRISCENEDGKEIFVKQLFKSQSFGESGMASGSYLETAVAFKGAVCMFLHGSRLQEIMNESPSLTMALMESMNQWMVEYYERFRVISHLSVQKRLELYFLSEARLAGGDEFELKLRKHEVASNLGIRPETLSRALQDLENNGLITQKGDRMNISTLSRLRGST